MRTSGAVLACLLGFVVVSPAAPQPLFVDAAKLLKLQNRYRAQVGVPPLRWSARLARGAQAWAETIAALDQLRHSGTFGVGENLAMSYGPGWTLERIVGLWGAEKAEFVPGRFPDVSTTGNWKSVGHYTQMVWRDTTRVGCGRATNRRAQYLVCWYDPQGNFIGRMPY